MDHVCDDYCLKNKFDVVTAITNTRLRTLRH